METRNAFRALGAIVIGAALLGGAGCVSAQEHQAALADLQRLRVEAWQKSVEAASLRMALDRAAAENAALRTPAYANEPSPVMAAMASKLEEISRRQEVIEDQIKTVSTCGPAGAGVTPASGQPAQPHSRKVTDLLYSRF